MKREQSGWLVASVLLLQLVIAGEIPAASAQDRIAIITSADASPYLDAVRGITEHFDAVSPDLSIDVFITSGDQEELQQAFEAALSNDISLLVPLGSRALRASRLLRFDGPIVGALVLDERSLAEMPNATGIVLRQPPSVQFGLLKRFLPDARRVGVIYTRALNEANVEQARNAAEAAGLVLDAVAVDSPTEIPIALSGLARRVDVLWGIPDSMVMSSTTAKHILLASLRNRVPLIGPAPAWSKAGALYSIEWNYHDIGTQTAEMALALLDGQSVEDTPPMAPRTVGYSINLKTAAQCNLAISDPVIDGASEVFR